MTNPNYPSYPPDWFTRQVRVRAPEDLLEFLDTEIKNQSLFMGYAVALAKNYLQHKNSLSIETVKLLDPDLQIQDIEDYI
jgi:hypothetical protein